MCFGLAPVTLWLRYQSECCATCECLTCGADGSLQLLSLVQTLRCAQRMIPCTDVGGQDNGGRFTTVAVLDIFRELLPCGSRWLVCVYRSMAGSGFLIAGGLGMGGRGTRGDVQRLELLER